MGFLLHELIERKIARTVMNFNKDLMKFIRYDGFIKIKQNKVILVQYLKIDFSSFE